MKKIVLNKENMNDGDRDEYARGILKTMGDEMSADIGITRSANCSDATP